MVTISRQAGAGGDEIARLLAEELGWKLLDNEAVDKLLADRGFHSAETDAFEERKPDFWHRFPLREGKVPSLPEAGELRVRAAGRVRHPGQGRPGPVRGRAGHHQGQDHRSPAGQGRGDARTVGRGRTRNTTGHPALGQRAGGIPSLPLPCRLGLSRSLRPGHQHPRHSRAGRGRPGGEGDRRPGNSGARGRRQRAGSRTSFSRRRPRSPSCTSRSCPSGSWRSTCRADRSRCGARRATSHPSSAPGRLPRG